MSIDANTNIAATEPVLKTFGRKYKFGSRVPTPVVIELTQEERIVMRTLDPQTQTTAAVLFDAAPHEVNRVYIGLAQLVFSVHGKHYGCMIDDGTINKVVLRNMAIQTALQVPAVWHFLEMEEKVQRSDQAKWKNLFRSMNIKTSSIYLYPGYLLMVLVPLVAISFMIYVAWVTA